jgi:hypothetical protein
VSACLRGEEAAVRIDAKANVEDGSGGSSARARTAIYDVAHEYVDPSCTERVCLHLTVPPDAPCTLLASDAVHVTTTCAVDVTVGPPASPPPEGGGPRNNKNKANGFGGFRNLRLDIPVRVVHPVASFERREEDGCLDPRQSIPSIDELMGDRRHHRRRISPARINNDDPSNDPASFPRGDIAEELKILSLVLADRCGLRPRLPFHHPKSLHQHDDPC